MTSDVVFYGLWFWVIMLNVRQVIAHWQDHKRIQAEHKRWELQCAWDKLQVQRKNIYR